jgi:hypothetical protein
MFSTAGLWCSGVSGRLFDLDLLLGADLAVWAEITHVYALAYDPRLD